MLQLVYILLLFFRNGNLNLRVIIFNNRAISKNNNSDNALTKSYFNNNRSTDKRLEIQL